MHIFLLVLIVIACFVVPASIFAKATETGTYYVTARLS